MAGRYGGNDLLNKTLMVTIFVILVIQLLIPDQGIFALALSLLAWSLIIWYIFRIFSRNTTRRVAENYAYYTLVHRLTKKLQGKRDMFRQRKEYRFLRCPGCKCTLRIPRGKGRLNVHCRQCGHSFEAKT